MILLCTDGLTGFVDEAAPSPGTLEQSRRPRSRRARTRRCRQRRGRRGQHHCGGGAASEAEEPAMGAAAAVAVARRPRGPARSTCPPSWHPRHPPASTAVALAVPPPVDQGSRGRSSAARPPRARGSPAQRRDPHLRAGRVVTGFGSRAPVRRRGRARRLGVFASVAALMLVRALGCADRAALVALRRRSTRPPARSRSTRASRTTSARA